MFNKTIIKSFFYCIIIISLAANEVFTQNIWSRSFGGSFNDAGTSIQQTIDEGYIIAGYTSSFGAGSYDVWLIKTDVLGDTLWTKTYGGSSSDGALSVQLTDDQGYIIAGYTSSFGAGGFDVWLIKTNEFGDTLWTKTYGGVGVEQGYSVEQTTDGGYIIAGYTSSFGAGGFDVWLIKTNEFGDTLWTKTFGKSYRDDGTWIQQTNDQGYILTGSYDNGNSIWLIKTDTNGDSLWTKTFSEGGNASGCYVLQTSDGGFIVTGSSWDWWYMSEYGLVVKYNNQGNFLWKGHYGTNIINIVRGIVNTIDRKFVIAGTSAPYRSALGDSEIFLTKIDSAGNELWEKTFDGDEDDYCYSVINTNDGGYIIAGWTESYGAGGSDVILIKTDSLGNSILLSSDYDNFEFPHNSELLQNYPNPFNPSTKIRYSIPQISNVVIKVFDILGNEIETLVNKERQAGIYEITWYAESLPSGIYFYSLQAGNFIETKKMILLK